MSDLDSPNTSLETAAFLTGEALSSIEKQKSYIPNFCDVTKTLVIKVSNQSDNWIRVRMTFPNIGAGINNLSHSYTSLSMWSFSSSRRICSSFRRTDWEAKSSTLLWTSQIWAIPTTTSSTADCTDWAGRECELIILGMWIDHTGNVISRILHA